MQSTKRVRVAKTERKKEKTDKEQGIEGYMIKKDGKGKEIDKEQWSEEEAEENKVENEMMGFMKELMSEMRKVKDELRQTR